MNWIIIMEAIQGKQSSRSGVQEPVVVIQLLTKVFWLTNSAPNYN